MGNVGFPKLSSTQPTAIALQDEARCRVESAYLVSRYDIYSIIFECIH